MDIPSTTSAIQQASQDSASQQQMIRAALEPVSEELFRLDATLIELLPLRTQSSQDVAKHIFAAGGKRIRPALYFLACRALGYNGPHLQAIGAVCEYVHTASLLHDDVVDDSTLRRNKPTANATWGDQSSVLVGDLIYARASELMAATGSLEIVTTFAQAIRKMSEGELMQLEHCFNGQLSMPDYLEILRCKTAVLIGASCRAAGILAKASPTQCDALTEFGHSVGMAFQLIDDALDYMSNDAVFGKPTHADLLEGKVTLPVILLRDVASPEQQTRLAEIFAAPELTSAEVNEVSAMIAAHGTAIKTIELAQEYTERAQTALHALPASAARDDLQKLAECLVWRFS